MSQSSLASRIVSVLWALLLTAGVIVVAGSMLMPATKSGRVNLDELRRREAEETAAADVADTQPVADDAVAVAPTTQPK